MRFQRATILTLIFCLSRLISLSQEAVLFEAGDMGYSCFRIPAVVEWKGDLFAFAEGRRGGCDDFGDVDILMRRSFDGGHSWGTPTLVVDNGGLQAGNSSPVVDRMDPAYPDGRLLLFYNTGTASEYDTRMGRGRRRAFYTASTDHGTTWSEPVDFSGAVHEDRHSGRPHADARTLAFGPGHALQLSNGPHAGRLFIPANHSVGPPQNNFADYETFGMWSDDHGQSWQVSPDLGVPSSNEAMAAQTGDGALLVVVRMQNSSDRRKRLARSRDGGATWDSTWMAAALTTPVCQSALLHVEDIGRTYHVGPADTTARQRLTLWDSADNGRSWNELQTLWPGSAAYVDIVYLHGALGVLYERDNYQRIAFVRVPID